MALTVSYGVRKVYIHEYEYFTIDFRSEQDRQVFYFNYYTWDSVSYPKQYVEKMIKDRIKEIVMTDQKNTGPLTFLFKTIENIIKITTNHKKFHDAITKEYNIFLTKPHTIVEVIEQAKQTLNKLSTQYNINKKKKTKHLTQHYFRKNLRPYLEQKLYLNSFIYGLRRDYPAVFKKSPNIIENNLSDCILKFFGIQIRFKQQKRQKQQNLFDRKNKKKKKPRRKEWFKSLAKHNAENSEQIIKTCLEYSDFLCMLKTYWE